MDYKFSVVMPLYNTERFFKDAIESIIGQSFGIDNIQLILVNDGSTDSTRSLCEAYQKKHPYNIEVINKENGGVSSARNEGISLIKGKYTVFFDGDDIWDLKAFDHIYSFFEEHYNEIDACSCRMKYLGEFTKRHPLDFKYEEGKKIVDLETQPNYIQTTIGNIVFKTDAIGDITFNENMKYGEDSLFGNSIIVQRMKIGVVPEAVFYYRRTQISATKSVSRSKYWYLDIPVNYYGELINLSNKKLGRTVKYVQALLIYDIQWRRYTPFVESLLSRQEKEMYYAYMVDVLNKIEDKIILSYTSVNQYYKLALLNVKYQKNILAEAVRKGYRYYYKNLRCLSLRSMSLIVIHSITVEDDHLLIEGYYREHNIGCRNSVEIISNDNRKYSLSVKDYSNGNVKGILGETIAEGVSFRVELPAIIGTKYKFVYKTDNQNITLSPSYSKDMLLNKRLKNSFFCDAGYMIKHVDKQICIYRDSFMARFKSSRSLQKELSDNMHSIPIERFYERVSLVEELKRKKLKKTAAFFSIRNDGSFLPNLECVYKEYPLKKIQIAKRSPFSEEQVEQIAKELYQSKVVVTDDYCYFFRRFGKKRGQHFIQLWHAAGAFKMFGLDVEERLECNERKYHKDYDLVCTSSEYVCDIYARAFGISRDKVKALGVPRTDCFFNTEYRNSIADNIYQRYPHLKGKQVILYAPTFRDLPGLNRAVFSPDLDFEKLSSKLPANTVYVICPHPVMQARIIDREYENIIEIRDVTTNEMMFVADLLVTDYSSVIFEFSLLDKPMAFYCYDYDEYERNFYLDYETELPGEVFKCADDFYQYISNGEYFISPKTVDFREKYMGACDGNSTKRIVEAIVQMI